MRNAVITLILLVLTSCSKPPQTNEIAVGHDNFVSIVEGLGFDGTSGYLIQHQYHSFVTKDWINDVFTPAFEKFQAQNNLWVYEDDTFTCGDFSDWARIFAKKLWMEGGNKHVPMAGKFLYYPENQPGHILHAIVVFVSGDSNTNAVPLFYEPQLHRIIELTDKERKSVTWTEW